MISRNYVPYVIVVFMVLAIIVVVAGVQLLRQQQLNLSVSPTTSDGSVANIIPFHLNDHRRGSDDAPVKIIEYSDFECPFCAEFHLIMQRLLQAYPNRVEWVYRHFPLTSIHPQALNAAVVSECIALGGQNAFWQFADAAFANQEQLGTAFYQAQVQASGVSTADYDRCIADERVKQKIQAHLQNAVDSGATGTPFIVIILPDGRRDSFSGVPTYEVLESIITSVSN